MSNQSALNYLESVMQISDCQERCVSPLHHITETDGDFAAKMPTPWPFESVKVRVGLSTHGHMQRNQWDCLLFMWKTVCLRVLLLFLGWANTAFTRSGNKGSLSTGKVSNPISHRSIQGDLVDVSTLNKLVNTCQTAWLSIYLLSHQM